MSCHLACLTCHNKFFKISNMSIPTNTRYILKPNSTPQKFKKLTSSELEATRRNNIQLERENDTLKAEISDLALKNDNLIQALDKSRDRFESDLNKLQHAIRANEKQLTENSQKGLEQQKLLGEEITKLKQKNEDLKKQRYDVEISMGEKLKSLESEIKILKLDNENLRCQNKENEDKCIRYKMKWKQTIKVVNELNQIIAQISNKPEILCVMTQTDWANTREKRTLLDCSQSGDPRYKRDLNSENLILSDIFFKPKPFMDSEIELFSARSKTNYLSKPK